MNRYLLPALLFLGTLYFGFLFLQGPGHPQSMEKKQSKQGAMSYSQVQQLKKETAIKVGIRQQQAQMDKRVGGPELDPGYKKRNKFHNMELNGNPTPVAASLEQRSDEEPMTLDQRMDEFLARKQRYEQLAESQKREYVTRFIHEAYKMGFVVKVNENLEVISVEKVPSK